MTRTRKVKSQVRYTRKCATRSFLPMRGLNYRIASGALHTNAPDVVLTYIFRPDESSFPPSFDAALIAKLSAEFTIPVTESTSRSEAMTRLAEREFERARQIDAQQDTPGRIEDFTLIDVRS